MFFSDQPVAYLDWLMFTYYNMQAKGNHLVTAGFILYCPILDYWFFHIWVLLLCFTEKNHFILRENEMFSEHFVYGSLLSCWHFDIEYFLVFKFLLNFKKLSLKTRKKISEDSPFKPFVKFIP